MYRAKKSKKTAEQVALLHKISQMQNDIPVPNTTPLPPSSKNSNADVIPISTSM